MVTPRFLCTGGVDPYADPNTCKGEAALLLHRKPTKSSSLSLQHLSSTGDSGGPLIIHKRSRFIQVSAQASDLWGDTQGQHAPRKQALCMWLVMVAEQGLLI